MHAMLTPIVPRMQGARYWRYSLNELGMEDVAAQVGTNLGRGKKRASQTKFPGSKCKSRAEKAEQVFCATQ